MIIVWNSLLHLAVLLSTLLLGAFLLKLITGERNHIENSIRAMACAVGFLIYMGSKAIGGSIPQLLFGGMQEAMPIRITLVGGLFPAAVGWIVAFFCIWSLRKGESFVSRIIILFGVFIFTAFVDTYILTYSIDKTSNEINKALMPNISFIVGVVMYVVLNVKPEQFASANKRNW